MLEYLILNIQLENYEVPSQVKKYSSKKSKATRRFYSNENLSLSRKSHKTVCLQLLQTSWKSSKTIYGKFSVTCTLDVLQHSSAHLRRVSRKVLENLKAKFFTMVSFKNLCTGTWLLPRYRIFLRSVGRNKKMELVGC